MNYICKHCGRICKNTKSLVQHEKRCKLGPDYIKRSTNTDLEDLSEIDKRLLLHYVHLYPDTYKQLYKQLQNKYVEQKYKKYDAAKLAKKDVIQELILIDEPIQIANNVWKCPICGLHIKDMGTHVKRIHELTWKVFIEKYNWKESQIFCDLNHRKNLSANKARFYNETAEGKNLKKIQSIKMSGENNPACRDDVKLKLSKSRRGKHMSTKNKFNISKSTTSGLYSENAKSYGYIFWAEHNGEEKRFRSKTEYLIALMFQYYNIDVEYEPYKIEYFDVERNYLRHYIIDFVHKNRIFEVKPNEVDLSTDKKYQAVQQQLSKVNKKLELLTPSSFASVFNIPEKEQKPLSFFNKLIIKNIISGECKLKFPTAHNLEFYLKSTFIKSLGDDPRYILQKGEEIYENKKNSSGV